MLAIGADSVQLREFQLVFGARFLGLIDPASSVYQSWRVPNPTAPYPQDYIVDQQGIVRYWSDSYDPHEVMATVDRLLGSGVAETVPAGAEAALSVRPSVAAAGRAIRLSGGPDAEVEVFSAAGRSVARLRLDRCGEMSWSARVAPGVYFVRVPGAAGAQGTAVVVLGQ